MSEKQYKAKVDEICEYRESALFHAAIDPAWAANRRMSWFRRRAMMSDWNIPKEYLDQSKEIDRLLDQVAYLAEENIGYVAQLNEALGRIAELEAENERLVELMCEAFESDDPGSFQEWCDMNGYRLAKGERHE